MSSQYDMMDNTAWGKEVKQSMIKKAAEFAKRAHDGVYRKGTQIPYITHPMETAAIVTAFTGRTVWPQSGLSGRQRKRRQV